ncbi:MAG: tetratricopeptide repeat protein [Polyangia bacterium]
MRPDLGHGVREALRWLALNEGWLLIFDGVQDPQIVQDLLPSHSDGHVLITTAHPDWPVVYERRCRLTRIGHKPDVVASAAVPRFTEDEGIDFSLKLNARNEPIKDAPSRFLLTLSFHPLALGIVGALREWHLVSTLWERACEILRIPVSAVPIRMDADTEVLELALRIALDELVPHEGALELLRLYAVLGAARVPDELLVALAPHLAEGERPRQWFTLKRCGLIQHSIWGGRMHRAVADRVLALLRRSEHKELVAGALAAMTAALQRLGYGTQEPLPADWIPHVLALARRAAPLGLCSAYVVELLGRCGRSLLQLGLPELALSVLEEELVLRRRGSLASQPEDPAASGSAATCRSVLDVLRDLGRAAVACDQPERAVGYLQRALRLLPSVSSVEAPDRRALLHVQHQLGEAAFAAHQFELAADALLSALDLAEQAASGEPEPEPDPEPLSLALCAEDAARCLEHIPARAEEARALRERAHRLATKERAETAGTSARMVRLGELQLAADAPGPALDSFTQAIQALPGKELYRLRLRAQRLQATALTRLGRYDEAASSLRGMLYTHCIDLGLLPERELAEVHCALGKAEEQRGELSEAAVHYQRALELYHELGEPGGPLLGILHLSLSRVRARLGEHAAAVLHCQRGGSLIKPASEHLSQKELQAYAALREELLRAQEAEPLPLALQGPVPAAAPSREGR